MRTIARNSFVPLRVFPYCCDSGDDVGAGQWLVEDLQSGPLGKHSVVFRQQDHGRSGAEACETGLAFGGGQVSVQNDAGSSMEVVPGRLPGAMRRHLVAMRLQSERKCPQQGGVLHYGYDGQWDRQWIPRTLMVLALSPSNRTPGRTRLVTNQGRRWFSDRALSTARDIRTSSGRLRAFILVMTLARWTSTVRGLMSRLKAIALFG